MMQRRQFKPYVGIILVVLYGFDIFWISGILERYLGTAGMILHELLLLLIAVGAVLLFRGDRKLVFPLHKPQPMKVLGTLVLWLGVYLGTMLITIVVAYFFPEQIFGAGKQISGLLTGMPFLVSLFVVAIVPAVCEEAAFRGALLSSFRSLRNKWVVIFLVSVIFGAFHGSVWRFIPTALLGAAMGYLLFETDNMVYNIIFHFVNNMVPLVTMAVLNGVLDSTAMGNAAESLTVTGMPLMSLGSYMIYGGASPFLIYIGDYLIHRGQEGYRGGMFTRDKRHVLIGLVTFAAVLLLLGFFVVFFSVALETVKIMRGLPGM